MGLEPITSAGADFKSTVYTIPPSAITITLLGSEIRTHSLLCPKQT